MKIISARAGMRKKPEAIKKKRKNNDQHVTINYKTYAQNIYYCRFSQIYIKFNKIKYIKNKTSSDFFYFFPNRFFYSFKNVRMKHKRLKK